jgi:transcriptional regulator with XRE-family HTH domain
MPRRSDIQLVFCRRLKEARERCQLSQKQLGSKAGLDQFVASTRINRYERGIHEPDLATVASLAEALKVPVAYLFAEDERLANMILAFDRLTAGEKDKLLKELGER